MPLLSRRTDWDLTRNRWSEAVGRARAANRALIDLTISNPTRVGLNYPQSELATLLAEQSGLPYQPSPFGLPGARESLLQHLAPGSGISPERVLLTASTSEAYRYLLLLLCDPGDEILIPQPGYPLFDYLADLAGVTLQRYPLLEADDWSIDIGALEQAIKPATRAVVAVSPNNPTGSVIDSQTKQLLQLCARHGLALIVDQVFEAYRFSTTRGPGLLDLAIEANVLTFILGGLSKHAGLPGHKLAWTLINGPTSLLDPVLKRLELIADTFLSAATPVQQALAGILRLSRPIREQIQQRCLQNLNWVQQRDLGVLTALTPAGGWSLVIKVPRIQSDEQWALAALEQSRIVLYPGELFQFPATGYLVVSLLTPPKQWRDGIRALQELASEQAT